MGKGDGNPWIQSPDELHSEVTCACRHAPRIHPHVTMQERDPWVHLQSMAGWMHGQQLGGIMNINNARRSASLGHSQSPTFV